MLDVNLNWYKFFWIVANSKSLSDASSKLNISVSAVSRGIKQLENHVGILLFYRENGTSMRLTATGKDFYDYIDKAFTQINMGEKILLQKNDIANGEIIIGCPSHISSFFLMDYVEQVNKDYPNLRTKIVGGHGGSELLELLSKHKIDFAIDSTKMDITDKDFVKKEIKEMENIFISNKELKISNLEEMESLTYLLPFEYTYTTKTLEKCFNENNISIKNRKEMDMTEVRIDAAKRGIGIGYVMKESVKNDLENEELYEVEIPFKLPKSAINLIYLKGQLTKVDKEFIKKYLKIRG